jgi:hypothetical protein
MSRLLFLHRMTVACSLNGEVESTQKYLSGKTYQEFAVRQWRVPRSAIAAPTRQEIPIIAGPSSCAVRS